jgi:phytoene dehydrogenase-like protein
VASTTNHYDLIVLGADIAGLVAAALVARRGKRVLVIPQGSAEGVYRLGGRPLALETSPVIQMGSHPVQRVFHELGLLQQVRRQYAPVDHLVHAILPDQRLDLQSGARNLDVEAGREWPGDPVPEAWALARRWGEATAEAIDELLASDNALVADGFWGRRFLSRVAGQLPGPEVDELEPLRADHPAREVAHAPLPWIQHLSPAQLGKAASMRLQGLWAMGPEDLAGGHPRLRELLLQRIELHSGEVKRELRVAEILVKRSKVVGVSLLGKRDRYGCDHLIVATDPRRLLDGTLAPEHVPRPLWTTLQAVEPVAHRFVLNLVIDERGLSPALDRMAVCLPDLATLADDPEVARGWAAHGVGRIYVRVFPGPSDETRLVSATRIIGDGEPLGDMREQILDELDARGVLPFCRPHLRLVHSPHDGREPTDGLGQRRQDLGDAPTLAHPMGSLYLLHGEPSLGVGILPHASGLKQMYFACRLTLPGLGLDGEFAAGTVAAGLVASPARSPFSRSPLLSRA